MLKRIPIVACPIASRDLFCGAKGLFSKTAPAELRRELARDLKTEHVFFFNSATAAFFVLLKVLREKGHAREVVLPAYTASSLVHAVQRAGLKPVLCDISLDDFDLDSSSLEGRTGRETLAVLGVHMFGMVGRDLGSVKRHLPGVFLLEDGAQSFGSLVNGDPVGRWADASFFSFNRGKNIPAYGGGCLVTDRDDLAQRLKAEEAALKRRGALAGAGALIKICALALAMRPFFYGKFFPLLASFKGQPAREDFDVAGWTGTQAAVVRSLFGRLDDLSRQRYNNGKRLIEGLSVLGSAVVLPRLAQGAQPAFNRLPVVFRDPKVREAAAIALGKQGIETSRMYPCPLHHAFDLGYKQGEFPNAERLAEALLTLPVHPLVTDHDIDVMIEAIMRCIKQQVTCNK